MRSTVLFIIALAFAVTCQATTYSVYADGSGDFPTIQAAVTASVNGDTIELGDGVFSGAGNRGIDPSSRAITIRAQNGPGGNCIIDCEGSAGDPHRAFFFDGNDSGGLLIQGITIQNGYGDSDGGGAIWCYESLVTFEDCIFWNNHAEQKGGAVYCESAYSAVQFTRCLFAGNEAEYYGEGGGIHLYDGASATFTYCRFNGNNAYTGGDIYVGDGCYVDVTYCTLNGAAGDGVYVIGTGMAVINRTIISFGASQAVACYNGGTASLTCCDLYGNQDGDWVGCIAGQFGVNGDNSADNF